MLNVFNGLQTSCAWRGFLALGILVVSPVLLSGSEAGAGTCVQVRKGAVQIIRDGEQARLMPGQEAHLQSGAPAHVQGTVADHSGPSGPIRVQWEPGQTVVMIDHAGILLRASAEGRAGRSDDGVYDAQLSADGELRIADAKYHRTAIRLPDGTWIHRFAGNELRAEPSGRTTLRVPDGRELVTVDAIPNEARVSPAATDAAGSGQGWKVGVHLDKSAQGLRVKGVSPDSPAEAAGFLPGDEVLAIDQHVNPSLDQIQARLQAARAGERILFTVRRGEQTVTLVVFAGAVK